MTWDVNKMGNGYNFQSSVISNIAKSHSILSLLLKSCLILKSIGRMGNAFL